MIQGKGVTDDRPRGNSFNLLSLALPGETEEAGELRLFVLIPARRGETGAREEYHTISITCIRC